jgi:hypothetical protein
MANHSPNPDNYPVKRTWAEVMDGSAPAATDGDKIAADKAKREADKGAAAKNGGGDK